MKLRIVGILAGCLSLLLLVPPTFAQSTAETASTLPRLVRFGGAVKDINGNPLTGVVGVTFALYSEQTGGAALWLETQNVTADSNGRYVALLGSTKPEGLPTDLFTTEQARWVGVQVSGQAEQPRALLVSAPYALKAVDAESLGGRPASAYLLNPQTTGTGPASAQSDAAAGTALNLDKSVLSASITGGGTKDYIPRWTGSSKLGDSILYQSAAGSLGIGTTSPAATLDIEKATGVRAVASGNGTAVYGDATVASGTGKGVEGDSSSTSGTGVAGNASATTGFTQGVWGQSASTSGVGVYAKASASTGSTIGVEGISDSNAGIAGVFNNTAGGKILSGQANGTEVFSVGAAGAVTGSVVNALASFDLAGLPFAFGSYSSGNVFLGFAGNATTTGNESTAIGSGALVANTTGVSNTATGYKALSANTTGVVNTATGAYTLASNTTGFANVATGYAALGSNTTGSTNTATGDAALGRNTTGSFNTANGFNALASNTTGGANTAIGYGVLSYNTTGGTNTAVGYNVLFDNTKGTLNTAIGYTALGSNTAGGSNAACGAAALFFNTTGSGNTALGYEAGYNVATGSNNIEIGNSGTSSDSGAIRIGTAGPQTSAFIAGIYGVKTSANNAVPVLIDSNGNLGTISSSRRYKEDIQDMGDASSGLMRLRPVTFRYKKPFADGSKPVQYGLIAEEVAEVYPDLVARSADGQIETVKYQLLDPMLLNEVQRQQAEIRELQERLSKMEAALASLSQAAESR